MSSDNEHPPPPSYSEATSPGNGGLPQDGVRPEGWVDGYVDAPRADLQAAAAEYQPPAAATDKKPVPSSEAGPEHAERGAGASSTEVVADQPISGRLYFGGLDLGGRVLGYGSGDGVGGWGLKIGPVLLGLVDVEAEKLRREKEGAR